MPASDRRPATGFGHYLRDIVYGALDGVITTLAIVTAASGAALPSRVGMLLGVANLIADGVSMGASNYLGLKSELEQQGTSVRAEAPWRHGLATLAAFVTVGSIPLCGYVLAHLFRLPMLPVAVMASLMALFVAGATRARFVGRRVLTSGLEMVGVGVLAGVAAYAVGAAGDRFLAGPTW